MCYIWPGIYVLFRQLGPLFLSAELILVWSLQDMWYLSLPSLNLILLCCQPYSPWSVDLCFHGFWCHLCSSHWSHFWILFPRQDIPATKVYFTFCTRPFSLLLEPWTYLLSQAWDMLYPNHIQLQSHSLKVPVSGSISGIVLRFLNPQLFLSIPRGQSLVFWYLIFVTRPWEEVKPQHVLIQWLLVLTHCSRR